MERIGMGQCPEGAPVEAVEILSTLRSCRRRGPGMGKRTERRYRCTWRGSAGTPAADRANGSRQPLPVASGGDVEETEKRG